MAATITKEKMLCYHCGDVCRDQEIEDYGKYFCCEGCKLVHELLEENNLCTYYQLDQHPGIKPESILISNRFEWLDDVLVSKQLLAFSEQNIAVVTFNIPKIHCASCIYLLENLHKIESGISSSRVDFISKTVTITFHQQEVSLRKVVEVLHKIGYSPNLHLDDLKKKGVKKIERGLIYKIGIAGFCFGNIMMLSFPEYLTGVTHIEPLLKQFFSYLNLLLALPVFFISASDYFINSWKSARQKYFSIDLPIALGLLAMLVRSTYEIVTSTGPGYFDSMTGLVFFLLIGRYFQSITYGSMSFERDYQSYFPIAVARKRNDSEIYTPISEIKSGDKIVIHSEELIPADGLLLSGNAMIDYSFVTGESIPVRKNIGELIYAGGRQVGAAIELVVQKTVEQSYLTQLWNHKSFGKQKHRSLSQIADSISKYFTLSIILIAIGTAFYWIPKDVHRGILACTAILIIACPCALAITVPFTFGNIIRILGRNNFYLKNAAVIESVSKIDTIVFDKTGTLTKQKRDQVNWVGNLLTGYQWKIVKSFASQSIHPLSKIISASTLSDNVFKVSGFVEIPASGIEGIADNKIVRLGSRQFVKKYNNTNQETDSTRVYLSIDDHYEGYFQFNNVLREGLKKQVELLATEYDMYLISGDCNNDKELMSEIFSEANHLFFQQSPDQKLKFIEQLQSEKKKVMMIGDGLNDAGALQQSNVGVAVSDDLHQFSPACDVIMKGTEFNKINQFLALAKSGTNIIWLTFFISLLYNIVGISFAVRGELSPMIAAILMPLSSLSVIALTTAATRWKAASLKFT